MTADYKFEKRGLQSFIRYLFSPMAIIDLVSILPSLTVINSGFKVLRVLRMIRALRVLRVFKAMRYSKSFEIIGNVLRSSKESLIKRHFSDLTDMGSIGMHTMKSLKTEE